MFSKISTWPLWPYGTVRNAHLQHPHHLPRSHTIGLALRPLTLSIFPVQGSPCPSPLSYLRRQRSSRENHRFSNHSLAQWIGSPQGESLGRQYTEWICGMFNETYSRLHAWEKRERIAVSSDTCHVCPPSISVGWDPSALSEQTSFRDILSITLFFCVSVHSHSSYLP